MKVLFCNRCKDMVALRTWVKKCKCGEVYGLFLADDRTVLVNENMHAQVYGIDNSQFKPITYFVQYKDFDPDKPIENEAEIIKRKWAETAWADGGTQKLLEFIVARAVEEIPAKLEEFRDKKDTVRRLTDEIYDAKAKL